MALAYGTRTLQAPTDYSGIYATWNPSMLATNLYIWAGAGGDRGEYRLHFESGHWDFGTALQYPVLTGWGWREFGRQLRAGPELTVTAAGGPVELSWTGVDTGFWSPRPEVTYTVTRDDGSTVTVIGEGLSGLTATDAAAPSGAAYTYQVTAVVDGGEAAHSAPVALRTLTAAGDGTTVDLSELFRGLHGDELSYAAVSSAPAVVTASVSGSTLTLTPLAGGEATVTVTATGAGGTTGAVPRSFVVRVADHDADDDDDGLLEIRTLAQLDAVRHDLDGDGVPTGAGAPAHASAFAHAMPGMGCPAAGCTGYELATDLDFDTDGSGSIDAGDAWWGGGSGWMPIGTFDAPFTSTFAGNGHTVSHLFVRGRSHAGLFGRSDGVIRGVGLVAADVGGNLSVDRAGERAAAMCAGALVSLNAGRVEGKLLDRPCDGGAVRGRSGGSERAVPAGWVSGRRGGGELVDGRGVGGALGRGSGGVQQRAGGGELCDGCGDGDDGAGRVVGRGSGGPARVRREH